jgi:alpha-acetolactate decarboxylase
MKYLVIILSQFLVSVCFAAEKPYESYDQIVERLSKYRKQQVTEQISTTLPVEKFHMSFGLTNTSTRISDGNIGGVNQNGFLVGVAQPLISQQLFFEGFGKFFQNSDDENVRAGLQQYELRLSHKERLSFALLNMGVGVSARFLSITTPTLSNDYRIPSALITLGLERRLANRISVAGDVALHRSLRENDNGKNTAEFVLRLNYHL